MRQVKSTPTEIVGYAALTLACCLCPAHAESSGALPLGPDTWTIVVEHPWNGVFFGSQTALQKQALQEAQEFCSKQQKQFLVIGTTQQITRFQVTFRCLNTGDPELARPNLQPVPDVMIQVR